MFGQAVCCFLAAMLHLLWRLLERIWPAQDIELAPEFPSARQASGFEANPWAPSKARPSSSSACSFFSRLCLVVVVSRVPIGANVCAAYTVVLMISPSPICADS